MSTWQPLGSLTEQILEETARKREIVSLKTRRAEARAEAARKLMLATGDAREYVRASTELDEIIIRAGLAYG